MFGGIIYYAVMRVVLWLKVDADLLKLLQALIVAVFLAVPYWKKMLKVSNIYKTFNPGTVNEKTALNGVSLELAEGDFVTVIGGNGAGKSTLLNALAGVWQVDSGEIYIDGIDVTKTSEHKRAKYLGRVFQDPMMGTAATMGIDENLALAARRGKFRGLGPGITAKERSKYRELLAELDLGLETRLSSKVGLLSGFSTSTRRRLIPRLPRRSLKPRSASLRGITLQRL